MKNKKLLTPIFRVSFPHVFQPNDFGGSAKYSVVMLFPSDCDLGELRDAIKEAAREKWGNKLPANLRNPLRDGSEKGDLPGYDGVTFATASSKQKPGVVDANCQEIIDATEIYPGCYARATLSVYAYDVNGNKGVSFGLQNLQKVKDGEPFGMRSRASSDFSPIAVAAAEDDIFG